ncbi:MAG: response regulator transcription factor [Oscillospiraceae bacterium]|nr:response regulator transcription factor [Oscillospiraceae bacterium]
MLKVLIVEDERAIVDLIRLNLSAAGYQCTAVYNGLDAADLLENRRFDLILLDVMLPGADGYELMDYIRPLGIPVIFITAKHEVRDRVKGLKMGADDYLVKPFDIVELIARVETVLRRYHKGEKQIEVGDVLLDLEAHAVKKGGKPVNLTAKEFGLLALFIQNKNIALFREVLYEKVWEGEYFGDSRTVDLHVQRLRKKLGWENRLVTVHKIGYRLEVDE